MNKNLTILELSGYNDGYYWDERAIFKYGEEYFEYINIGSGSGYISNLTGLVKLDETKELLKNWPEKEKIKHDAEVCIDAKQLEEVMKENYEKLINSGKNYLTIYSDEKEKYPGEETETLIKMSSSIVYLRDNEIAQACEGKDVFAKYSIIEAGYCLDYLINDKDSHVKEKVFKQLKHMNLKDIEDYKKFEYNKTYECLVAGKQEKEIIHEK